MEDSIQTRIQKLPEGFYLNTSREVHGFVAHRRFITEIPVIARDVTRKLVESKSEHLNQIKSLSNTC